MDKFHTYRTAQKRREPPSPCRCSRGRPQQPWEAAAEPLPKRVPIKWPQTLSSGASSWTTGSACQARASWSRERTCFLRTSYGAEASTVSAAAQPPRRSQRPGAGDHRARAATRQPERRDGPGPKLGPGKAAGWGALRGPTLRLPTEAVPSPRVSTTQARHSGGRSSRAQRGP